MAKLIFDIETVGENFDSLDKTTRESLTYWIKKESISEEEYENVLEDVKNGLGFSPLTGEIIVIGVLDYERDKGVIYFQSPGRESKEIKNGNFTLRPMDEKTMLEKFWEGAKKYDEFISFNGRAFDAPFLIIRSAVCGVKPTIDLMEGRYLYQQRNCRHIDLLDQLTFYGAVRRKGNLHLWSRAFGIKSPKSGDLFGRDVSQFFRNGRFEEIARYNIGDLLATKELYEKWEKYIRG